MKPILQTFYINEPDNGAPGVFVTAVDLYFKTKSPTYGVELQIPYTDGNGNPTPNRTPFGFKLLNVGDVYTSDMLTNNTPYSDLQTVYNVGDPIIQVSNDASKPTRFVFDTPVWLQSTTSYALAVHPSGDNPDYALWTSIIGGTDVTTQQPVQTNNDTGTLFLSSNDKQFTAVQNEDFKFVIYRADFTATEGTAAFTSIDEDTITLTSVRGGSFFPTEKVYVSNNSYSLAQLNISANTGALTVGEKLFQSNGTANIAYGLIYSVNTSVIKITNSHGSWTNTFSVMGVSSTSNATVATVSQNVVVSNTANTITVPFTDIFTANQYIYLTSNTRSVAEVYSINSVVNSTSLQLSYTPSFSDNDAKFGRIRGDGGLYGYYTGPSGNLDNSFGFEAMLDGITANSTVNFANIPYNSLLIGSLSRASALVRHSVTNPYYDAIVPQFNSIAPPLTTAQWSFYGANNDNTFTMDTNGTALDNNIEKEFYDKERVVMSRSNEYENLPSGRKGDYTSIIYTDIVSGNSKVSPTIDKARTYVTYLSNMILPESELETYTISIEPGSNAYPFTKGVEVTQSNSSFTFGVGTIKSMTYQTMVLTNINGYFIPGKTIFVSTNSSINAMVTDTNWNTEALNQPNKNSSRYISKSVVLAENQDAEDVRTYLTAYRPAGTNLKVYARLQHREDPDPFNNKSWTPLTELSSPALLSSSININDWVELEYGLPTSNQLFDNTAITSNNTYITLPSTSGINDGDIVYVTDGNTNFYVREVRHVVNNSVLLVWKTVPYTSTNSAFGTIPGAIHPMNAFVYANNYNVCRYSSNTDVIYDTYKTFAIKIVPVADTTYVFPRAQNMRTIALQV